MVGSRLTAVKEPIQDIDKVEAAGPLVIKGALADPASQIHDAGEFERHSGSSAPKWGEDH
jgi:hypothetical protein